MLLFQIIASVSSSVIQNGLFNNICKKELRADGHIYQYNMILYAVCVLLFGVAAVNKQLSVFTVLLGVSFGVSTALGGFYKLRALSSGPMNITLLITTSSMIIPTMSGVFFGEPFNVKKLVTVIILIAFIYISLGKKKGAGINVKWLLYCVISFVLIGTVGVLQKIHQTSVYRGEINGFLFVAFVCSLVYSGIMAGKSHHKLHLTKKIVIYAIMCGVFTYSANFLNLRLSGLLPSQLFFPIVNGSAIILTTLMSVVIFHEKLSKKQVVGLCGGIVSLMAICIV